MKNGWTTKSLREVCVKCDLPKAVVGSTPYVEIGDVDVVRKVILFKEKGAVKGSIVAPGKSVLVSRVRPTRGAVTILEDASAVSSAFSVLRPAAELEFRLLFLCLAQSPDFGDYLAERQKGLLYPSVKEEDVLDYRIVFPVSLAEQQRIVGVLDEALAGLATAEAHAAQNLQNARALFESHLQSVFTHRGKGWVERTLGEVCEFENGDRGKNYPNREEYVEAGIPWINTGHIQPDGTLSQDEMNFITRAKFDSLRSGKIQPGDLVYCLRGATLGKTAIVDPYTEGAVASSLVIIRTSDSVDSRFLYFFLVSPDGQSQIKLYDNGAAQPNLGAKSVAKYVIPVPALAEQKRVADSLDELRAETQRLTRLYEQKQAALAALKKSLLHQAFNGEL